MSEIPQTADAALRKLRQHCLGCPECQSDYGCQEFTILRNRHRRLCAAEGDVETVRRYDKEDQELWQELEAHRKRDYSLGDDE